MATLLVGYDLDRPGQDYTGLIEAIKSLANGWWHNLDSTWLINTSLSPADVMKQLSAHLDPNDKLLVIDVGTRWATDGMPNSANKWLHTNWQPAMA